MSRQNRYFPYSLSNYKIIRDREIGRKPKHDRSEDLACKIYSNFDAYQADIPLQKYTANQGGIFNLEFSLDGRILVAACEEKSILLFDAANQRLVKDIKYAHHDCVNCVRFLDNRTFATCSDDNTIKLWDTRKLNRAMRTLQGHSNWVKNIEYIERQKILVTSAFDGSIYAWHLERGNEMFEVCDKVFLMDGLMRTKLTPDGSKLVICTTSGYMIIVHDLDLETLGSDTQSFRPNLYRLMVNSDETFPSATAFNYLFYKDRKTNRLEFIDDFPNDAEVISSLQIHPQGWCALSRNIDATEKEEWTCVHDIQRRAPEDDEGDGFRIIDTPAIPDTDTLPEGASRPSDIWMGLRTNEEVTGHRENNQALNMRTNFNGEMSIVRSGLIGTRHFRTRPEDCNRLVNIVPRMTHFVKEKGVGKGYIKELCFSGDGRIICSPYNRGIRLLGFNDRMQEMCFCVPNKPTELTTLVEMNDYHKAVVVSCKFNPLHYQMVSGCLGGDIVWYKPIL